MAPVQFCVLFHLLSAVNDRSESVSVDGDTRESQVSSLMVGGDDYLCVIRLLYSLRVSWVTHMLICLVYVTSEQHFIILNDCGG